MFGTLEKTLTEEWYNNEENRYITLVTDEGMRKYKIFSIYEEKSNKDPIPVEFSKDGEYLDFLNNVKSKSIKDFDVQLTSTKGIITLVAYSGNNRIILHAVKIM